MPELGEILIALARWAIAARFGLPDPEPAASDSRLEEPGATFVTLTKMGGLRGCIGSLEAHRALRDDVVENARAAAFYDPRFTPLTEAEWPATRIEVSLLSPPQNLPVINEADALRQMRPGTDGIVLIAAGRRATFLPQVWETFPDPADFLQALKRKAGLLTDYWGPELHLQRYTVQKWKE